MWLTRRMATTAVPCSPARSMAWSSAQAVANCPKPSPASTSSGGPPPGESPDGRPCGRIVPCAIMRGVLRDADHAVAVVPGQVGPHQVRRHLGGDVLRRAQGDEIPAAPAPPGPPARRCGTRPSLSADASLWRRRAGAGELCHGPGEGLPQGLGRRPRRRAASSVRRSEIRRCSPSGGRVPNSPPGRQRSESTRQAMPSRSASRHHHPPAELDPVAEGGQALRQALPVVALDLDRPVADGAPGADRPAQLHGERLQVRRGALTPVTTVAVLPPRPPLTRHRRTQPSSGAWGTAGPLELAPARPSRRAAVRAKALDRAPVRGVDQPRSAHGASVPRCAGRRQRAACRAGVPARPAPRLRRGYFLALLAVRPARGRLGGWPWRRLGAGLGGRRRPA